MVRHCEHCGAATRPRLRCPACHRVLERWPAWTALAAAAVVLVVQLIAGRPTRWSVFAAALAGGIGWALGRVFTGTKVKVWSGTGRGSWPSDALFLLLLFELIALAAYDLSYNEADAVVGLVIVFAVAPAFPAVAFAAARRFGIPVWRHPRLFVRRTCRACGAVQPWRYPHCQACGATQRSE